MPPRTTLTARWVTTIMVAALVCSVAVVWGLIQITDGSPAESSTVPPTVASPEASTVPSTGATADPVGSPSPGAASSSSETGTADGSDPTTNRSGVTAGPTSTPSTLPGSNLPLPAAWTGTAEMTITVTGRCADEGGSSSYTRAAELALQPADGAGPFGDPNPLSLSLGITPAGVPGVSVNSASAQDSEAVHRTWWLAAGSETGPAGEGRTSLSGVLIDDQPVRGVLPPNLLVDNETDLQPCESSGTVRVPRTLAVGSTIRGWVSPTRASLKLEATTVDGERRVSAVVELTRRAAP